ncbi:FAD-dependent monooxygenase [Staphylococcus sp. 18_1_E_LY]|uniref:FAD-dependent monooxygenase n=1 Tax=Staphylococcus lloydii TaxID=2781774 RepID=A0A7T1F9X8_9STAP|nr:FAD-dependent monooxygenase [Staphylococcus lloydii]MBF7020421.1 FAD-dependent monooxygenase [Staphylococcus lloydii]MBF7028104.1 FAD-dependent monooxygenase [Staphylococcus lloydii]QPM75767.1 FAD-dependent monooxygenase [Staphylococcus lloydii]
MKIAIIGAGIGGLTAAALLQEQGHEVEIYERNETVKEVGAGIGIGGNVLAKLAGHDLAKGIKNAGQLINAMEVLDDKGKTLSTASLKENTINLTLRRQTLLDVIKSYVEPSSIFTNHNVTHVENNSDKVEVHFEQQESKSYDLCIGADGLHSRVRASVEPESKPIYQGYTVFRGLVKDVHLKEPHVAKEYWTKKGRVGIVPLINNEAYWFISVNANEQDEKYKSYAKPHLQAKYNHLPNEVRTVLDKQEETGILLHDIYDLKPLKTFVYERTLLLGDAAHATTPNLGQGAGQAMEDAIVLANCIKTYDFEKALSRYDELRVGHTKKVIKKSRSIGKIAQSSNGLVIRLRNFMTKLIPNKLISNQTKFIYKTKDK